MKIHWLSFCDSTRPEGQQFLGVSIVEAPHFALAVSLSWDLGCNPGGQVFGAELPADYHVPPEFRDRLLDRDSLSALERINGCEGELMTLGDHLDAVAERAE